MLLRLLRKNRWHSCVAWHLDNRRELLHMKLLLLLWWCWLREELLLLIWIT